MNDRDRDRERDMAREKGDREVRDTMIGRERDRDGKYEISTVGGRDRRRDGVFVLFAHCSCTTFGYIHPNFLHLFSLNFFHCTDLIYITRL